MKLDLLEQLVDILCEANEALQKEIYNVAKRATHIPISMRTVPRTSDFSIVADGSTRGTEAADDHEIEQLVKAIEKDLGKKYEIERIFDRAHEKPVGLSFNSKNARGASYTLIRVFFQKKPVVRGKLDGDRFADYDASKLVARKTKTGHDRAGEKNERMFVKMIKEKIEEAGGKLTEIVFDGFTNDQKLTVTDIVDVKWVGGKNHKTDVELINEDGEIIKLSLKQRDYLEISAGNDYFHKHDDKIYSYLQHAIDHDLVKFDDEGNLSKDKSFEIAVEMNHKEAAEAYFGHEHDKVDAVVIETFVAKDFEFISKTNKLHVHCDYVLKSIDDVHKRIYPYISINSDFARDETKNPPVMGHVYVTIVPRYRLQTHARKTSGHAKTLILDR